MGGQCRVEIGVLGGRAAIDAGKACRRFSETAACLVFISPLERELARESVVSGSEIAGCTGLFAGKPRSHR